MNLQDALTRIGDAARVEGLICDASAMLVQHGDFGRWRAAFETLPRVTPSVVELRNALRIGRIEDCQIEDTHRTDDSVPFADVQKSLTAALRVLCPWRKGPIHLFGIEIDTEWRSDWKWARLRPHLSPLDGRRVLDVGCGNGYFGWRMAGSGAHSVLGVDPSLGYFMQYLTLASYLSTHTVAKRNLMLPFRLEDLPTTIPEFDTVFSMGVLYHRRDPRAHIEMLRRRLRVGGELVLETLVVPGSAPLHPSSRYARMRNVFEVPDIGSLVRWLEESGLHDIRVVDVTVTRLEEQRRTAWMTFDSLAEALDPLDPSRTVEGYPAPMRAIAVARG